MASSASSTSSSVDSDKVFGELDHGETYILHNPRENKILVESDVGITVFLPEREVNSRQMNPKQYHWHCILRDHHFHLRNAFSKKMLQIDPDSSFNHGGGGNVLVTREFNEKEGNFCVLEGSDGQYTLYHTYLGRLLPLSVRYDHHFDIDYLRTFWETREDAVVHWNFELVYNGMVGDFKVEYGLNDFEL